MMYFMEKYSPQIYTTGAYLRPMQVTDNDGEKCWVWYVEKFEGADSFCAGDIYNPLEVAGTLDDLLHNTTDK